MPHPGIVVTSGAGARPPSTSIDTGTGFLVAEVTSGPTGELQDITSVEQFTDLFGAPDVDSPLGYDSLDAAFRCGLGHAYVVGVADVDATGALTGALAKFPRGLGSGQVFVPDSSDQVTNAAVVAHAAATNRTALIQLPDGTPQSIADAATSLRAAVTSDEVVGAFGSLVNFAGLTPGTTRAIPLAACAMGLIARADARNGNAGNSPAWDQGWGAGHIPGALGLTRSFTDSQWDTLTAAGVNIAAAAPDGTTELADFISLSTDAAWKQLNSHRLRMQIVGGGGTLMRPFVARTIDGKLHLFTEVRDTLSAYLQQLYDAGVLFGATPADAFSVDVSYGPSAVNTPATVAAGQLKASVRYVPSQSAREIYLTITSEAVA